MYKSKVIIFTSAWRNKATSNVQLFCLLASKGKSQNKTGTRCSSIIIGLDTKLKSKK